MMRNIALSMGAMVVIAAVFSSSHASATGSHPKPNNSNENSKKNQLMVKREDGHTLTQKSIKVKNNNSKARYHFNEIKDTAKELYLSTPKEDRHYHSNTKTTSTENGKQVVNKKVVVYNINKNKTICNIVEHSKNGTTKNGDCSNIVNVKPPKEDCDEKEDNNTTPVVPNTNTDNEEVTETPKVVTKEDPKPETEDKTNITETQEVTAEGKGEETAQPESLPVTGASPVSGVLVALVAAIVTFVGYASALAFLEVRIKNQY